MVAIRSSLALFCASLFAASGVEALPFWRRGVINHDAVVGFPQSVPEGAVGQAMLKFKPWLNVANGCVPFPAVNNKGDTG